MDAPENTRSMGVDGFLVRDGTVDSKNRTANTRTSGGWKACYFILANEIIDRIAFFGIAANLITYMTKVLHEGTARSATNTTNWIGTIYMITLLGGFLADSFWGRYWTVAVSASLYLMGLFLLTLSSSLKSLKPPPCEVPARSLCPSASLGQLAFFFTALYMVGVGSGCMKPCVSSFGADQFDETNPSEFKRKASFFNWWFWGIHVGNLAAVTILVYIQDNVGWAWGFGIPTVLLAVSIVIFFCGTPVYRYRKPHGSPLTTIAKVIVSAISKWNLKMPVDTSKAATQFTFLDRAAMPDETKTTMDTEKKPSSVNPWNLCTRTQVEETKLVMKILPMWFGTLLFSTVVAQGPTLFVKQGGTLDSRVGKLKIPPASMLLFTNLTVLCSMPVYDRVFVPAAQRITKHSRGITMLQRMGTGMFIIVASMVAAGFVESKRLKVARGSSSNHGPLPMSIFWLLPQYIILGLGEVFTFTGQLEFFYDQAPDSMRSLGASLQLMNLGAGCFLSSILVTTVNKVTSHHGQPWIDHNINQGHLDYFYWLLAALNAANIGLFVPLAVWFKYKPAHIITDTGISSKIDDL